ncbi:hypothetical protein [Spirosoma endbachense]|uniref:Uncharacterized protein n=1 Tax=Spirosoma endbachense TaxID=2666025 RepID=A0A6P1W062_9BACT|nr:hypothetical protein [Spirosoma endbachense]QHV97968.1 hypothetical protein GJR95_24460 [Spirosoma endbachense]
MNQTNKSSVNTRPVIGQSLLQLGATKKKNTVVNYLLLNMAKLMLTSVAADDKFTSAVKEAADKTKARLLASHTEEELKPIQIMNDVAIQMVRKLSQCESVDSLNACRHYMEELANNRVMIMENVENPEKYGLNPNV